MKYLLGEDSEGDKPETCMVPDYTVRAFKDVEQSTWKYLKNIRSYKYQNDEKGQRVLIEKCQKSLSFL